MTDKTGEHLRDAQFMALVVSYAELVRELVERGVIDKDAMPKKLQGAEDSLRLALKDKTAASLLAMVRRGVTPK